MLKGDFREKKVWWLKQFKWNGAVWWMQAHLVLCDNDRCKLVDVHSGAVLASMTDRFMELLWERGLVSDFKPRGNL